MSTDVPDRQLNDGTTLPAIGFGTYPLRGPDGIAAIVSALECGYRLLDTAVNYDNETEVGEAFRRSGRSRHEVFLATKVPGRFHAHHLAVASVEDSLRRLGVDRLDVAMVHWPNPSQGQFVEAFAALVECRERGLVRSVGVSNFTERFLSDVIAATGVVPAVNQIEMHPLFAQHEMRAVNARLGVVTQAWSPLGKRQAPFGAHAVSLAAERHGVTPAQVILRWHLQLGSLPLPKSAMPQHQRANLAVFGFDLTSEEMEAIAGLTRPDGRLFGGDPETHEEP